MKLNKSSTPNNFEKKEIIDEIKTIFNWAEVYLNLIIFICCVFIIFV